MKKMLLLSDVGNKKSALQVIICPHPEDIKWTEASKILSDGFDGVIPTSRLAHADYVGTKSTVLATHI